MKQFYFIILLAALSLHACKSKKESQLVVVSTPYGEMTIKLYDKTPQHSNNFKKLASEGYFDSLLFHRVIRDFMIQGGDPNSRTAAPGAALGEGDPGYTIEAEILYPTYFHKKGVLAAARTGDQVNPEKRSSGSQFYIVQGKVYTDEELDAVESRVNNNAKQQLFYSILPQFNDSLSIYQKQGNSERLSALQARILELVDQRFAEKEPFHFADSIRQVYKTIGGTPFLDNSYTVFGEVVDGLNVIDSIASVATDNRDRPLQDVRMSVKLKKK
jgi:cyclophilin family peptidyl-prolyl cis-trans isomerase